MIVSEITNPFFPEIVQTFENLAVKNNYEILLTSTIYDPERIESSVGDDRAPCRWRSHSNFRNGRVAAGELAVSESAPGLRRVGPDAAGIVNIAIDYQHGIRQAIQHLAALRHSRVAFISGPLDLKTARVRRDCFRTAMSEIGLSPDLTVLGDHRMEAGMRALMELRSLSDSPTAILCSNDMTAIGVLREAYEQNIRIPDDLSVVGFDDIHLSEFTTPPLTTVQMLQEEFARIAFEALLHEVQRSTPSQEGVHYKLNTNLILRRSTALAPGGTPLDNEGRRRLA